jgi:hypothetical protein
MLKSWCIRCQEKTPNAKNVILSEYDEIDESNVQIKLMLTCSYCLHIKYVKMIAR